MCWRSLQCARQWCLFVCLPSGAKLTLGALQAREQTELCEHWPTVPSSQTANLHSCANRKPQRWGVGSWRGRGAFSRPPALSSLPIKTSIGRWGAVVRWWSPNQKLFFSNILLAPKLNWKKKSLWETQLVIQFAAWICTNQARALTRAPYKYVNSLS